MIRATTQAHLIRQHVGRPGRQRAKGDPGTDNTIQNLVNGAIAACRQDKVETAINRDQSQFASHFRACGRKQFHLASCGTKRVDCTVKAGTP